MEDSIGEEVARDDAAHVADEAADLAVERAGDGAGEAAGQGAGEAAAATPVDPISMVQAEVEWVTTALDTLVEFAVSYSFQLLGAVIILGAGVFIAGRVSRWVLRLQEQRNVDVTLRQFIASLVRIIIIVGFVIVALQKVGISVAPFLAAIGGLALGLSFALQAPVSNYGAGLVIILTRPFKVGDTIRVIDQWGVVEDINLSITVMTNEDGEQIVIPNKHIVGEVLVNSRENRVVEGVIGISYGDDPERALQVVRDVLDADPEVTSDPPGQVGIQGFGDSSVDVGFRYWVPTRSFFEVQYRVNLAVYKAIGEAGLNIPFPQREVRMLG